MKQGIHNNQTYLNISNNDSRHTPAHKHSVNRSHTIILSLALIVICSCIFGSSFSSAHESEGTEPVRTKCYKSIQVQAGDSLWSIARDNMTNEYDSIDEYLDEIADINHISYMNMDSIQEGTYLTIAYYNEI